MKIAVIGGSGLYDINNPSEAEELNITGTVTATVFKGDGSRLTGLPWPDCDYEDTPLIDPSSDDDLDILHEYFSDSFAPEPCIDYEEGEVGTGTDIGANIKVPGNATINGTVKADSIKFKKSDGSYQDLLEKINDLSNKIEVLTEHVGSIRNCLGRPGYGLTGGFYWDSTDGECLPLYSSH